MTATTETGASMASDGGAACRVRKGS